MPIDIETFKQGEPVQGVGIRQKVSDEEILAKLSEAAYTKKELAEMFGVSPGTIYSHLRKLVKAGKVEARKVGNQVYYAAKVEG